MNAFRKLLLAPVALGLAAPVAAQAQSFDMGNVNRYTQQQDTDRMRALEAQMGQVTSSANSLTSTPPTHYQALANLVETYGCVAGYPDGTFKGNIALTRYEAVALLNACLDRVTEITEELKRLMKEFEKELVVLKARVDGLEAQTAELAATQFSTTTKLTGTAFFWLGAAPFTTVVTTAPSTPPVTPQLKYLPTAMPFSQRSWASLLAALSTTSTPPTAPYCWSDPNFKSLTKAATWSGLTGAGTNAFSDHRSVTTPSTVTPCHLRQRQPGQHHLSLVQP